MNFPVLGNANMVQTHLATFELLKQRRLKATGISGPLRPAQPVPTSQKSILKSGKRERDRNERARERERARGREDASGSITWRRRLFAV